MKSNKINYNPIGIIHTPFKEIKGTPIQPFYAMNIKGTIELRRELTEGLKDLEGFSHIILIYHFHLSKEYSLSVVPFLDSKSHGIFATRAPRRPNPIGLSIVKLVRIENNILHIENVDVVDGTPLLDIKPHISEFENQVLLRTGWLNDKFKKAKSINADNRFG
ncbi:MAG: tRNA (N6-threonylcarbamoyladenosine(37)-N6)-methyltransferase TrmO [Ignavibacteria bacterium]|jgi:tRNA-Thr(GGU) m(6)t(6)A37 methyltransferase TsaA